MKSVLVFVSSFAFAANSYAYPAPEGLLDWAARGAVGCQERLGEAMPLSFDEEGICGEESVWLSPSENASVIIKETSREIQNGGSSYLIQMTADVSYTNASGQNCAFSLNASFTDEDVLMHLDSPSKCIEKESDQALF